MFALVDCNNFYASCERLFRPELNGKPVVILSNNDGCVIARSNEAKELGIPMGAAAFKFKQEFKEKGIHVFSSNYALYQDMSNRVMKTLASFAPEIEVYSIDESFLKFENCDFLDLEEYGRKIHDVVFKNTGIPISVGFAPTKVLAKAANRVAKKFPVETDGVFTIKSDESRLKALKWLKIEDVWGIGRRHAARLNSVGVLTAYDFTLQSDDWVKKQMSVIGLRLKHELEGKPTLDLEEIQSKKSIATTRSFEKTYKDFNSIKERVSTFSASCAQKLRKQKSHCNSLMVFIHTNGFRKDLKQYKRSIVINLPYPTSSSIELSKFATDALKKIYKEGYEYKKAGVVVMGITPEDKGRQVMLFDNSNEKHKSIFDTIDKLNASIGSDKIKLASQDINRTWKMKQERLSPRYTTRLSDVFVTKA